ncbi:Transcription initiation factor IIA subunit 2 [Tetrabaena socialis]|uniref:Transcription initiation factor IIA subunit 2 n=1 Tax=Tetrabaena socialis TaxID=47790 RepID=A0A2J7ZS27_9CHLO|nr:Transcription initiation factor IIA subunit 2 [Tetrabaena socialis]|eukprot:PNH03040.1 Transcription initiation factor IIA subunit 2 [Tetrabaena socialis]
MSFQIYRNTSVGESLMETIEQLAEEGKLPEEVAMAVLKQFDTSMSEAIKKFVVGKATMKANMKTYHYYENVWTFSLENVEFKLNSGGAGSMSSAQNMMANTAKIVVVDAKLGETV